MSAITGLLSNKILWIALVFGALWGAYKWEGYKVKAVRAELAAAIEAKGKIISDLMKAETTNKGLKGSLDLQAEDAEMQARAADQARAKERLAWQRLNKLQKEIANATDNPPIPDALESILDAYRVRSAVPGDERPDSDIVSGDADAGGPPGPVVPDPAAPTS